MRLQTGPTHLEINMEDPHNVKKMNLLHYTAVSLLSTHLKDLTSYFTETSSAMFTIFTIARKQKQRK